MMRNIYVTFTLVFLVNLSFSQSFSNLTIKMSTEGADVFIDDIKIKPQDLNKKLTFTSGMHILKATKNGYIPYEQSLNLIKGEKKIIAINLVPNISFMTFQQSTEGADVFIDGALINKTDLNKALSIVPGKHKITAAKNGFRQFEQSIELTAGERKNIIISLDVDKRSAIYFSSNYMNTSVSIDGSQFVELPINRNVEAGVHTLEFREPNKIPLIKNIVISERSKYNVQVNLLVNLPTITNEDVGRAKKQSIEVNQKEYRSTTKKEIPEWKKGFLALILPVSGLGALGLVSETKVNGWLAIGAGVLLGYGVSFLLLSEEVRDKENIEYNRRLEDKVYLENVSIRKYNIETANIIKEKQMKEYSNNAVEISISPL